MLSIGITGGIGSGKSTVAKIFALLGVPVYYADEEAKGIMNSDPVLINEIIRVFGSEAYQEGKLNRAYLASKVFNDEQELAKLNAIVHPATIRHAEEWLARQSAPYVIKEAALLFESGSYASLDYVIGVSAPYQLRLSRAMKRDGISSDQVLARMQKQIDENIKMKLCQYIVYNDEAHLLIPQVLHLHNEFMSAEATKA